MKYYFYQKDGLRHGPFTYEELKSKRLLKNTFVWTEGMEDWSEAHTLDELKDIVVAEPPPIIADKTTHGSKQPGATIHSSEDERTEFYEDDYFDLKGLKYDPTFKRESDATLVGVFFLIGSISLSFVVEIEKLEQPIFVIINLIYRILITVWVVNISDMQNRNKIGWGIFAFILPTLALIIIGLLKKKIRNVRVDGFVSKKQKLDYCLVEANKFYHKKRLIDSLAYLNKALEIDEYNENARDMREKVINDLNSLK